MKYIDTFEPLKRISAILLCIILCSSFALNIAVLAWFQIEKSYIVSELCENRFDETSACEGHCVLSKKIDDVQPDEGVVVELKLLSFVLDAKSVKISNDSHVTFLFSHGTDVYHSPDLRGLLKPPIS